MEHVIAIMFSAFQENGPTIVGDRNSDPTLMEHLGARKITQPGNDL